MVGPHRVRTVSTIAIRATVLWVASLGVVQRVMAQDALWNRITNSLATASLNASVAQQGDSQGTNSTPRFAQPGPRSALARMVRNPQVSDELPPYALTDKAGTIQRYVEPVPGIDLEPYVDQIVVVRHDTGPTLLASQLELPPLPLMPLLGEPEADRSEPTLVADEISADRSREPTLRITLAQFVDDDDSTVQLLPDGETLPDGGKGTETPAPQPPATSNDTKPSNTTTTPPREELPSLPTLELPPETGGELGAVVDPGLSAPAVVEPYQEPWEQIEPCPECGGFHASSQCDPSIVEEWGPSIRPHGPPPTRLFADVEFNLLRTHLSGSVVGKLSEKYEFSPRVIIGFRDTGKLDGRIRYWHYDRDTPVLGSSPIALKFDVLDIEGTRVLAGHGFEVQFAGGLRLAGIDLTDDDDDEAGADLLGMTFAIEGRTLFAPYRGGQISWVYGGRVSILGGDWGAEAGNDFVTGLTQDDNVVVHELLAGIDYAFRHRGYDLHARLGFEMQNWHSDVLTPDSIGILGPNIQIGAEF